MKSQLLLLIVAAFYTFDSADGACASNYDAVGGYCFSIIQSYSQQSVAAQETCESSGGTLAVLDTDDQVTAVSQYLRDNYMGECYIGGYDQGHEGTWNWNTIGTPISNNQWAPGEPSGGTGLNCMALRPQDNVWLAHSCTASTPFVCKQLDPSCFGSARTYSVGTSGTWMQAKEYCEQNGKVLATVTSAADQQAVAAVANGASSGSWIGGYDQQHEGTWNWDGSGLAVTYTNWSAGSPGNDQSKNCIYVNADGSWVDGDCTQERGAICQDLPATCGFVTSD